MLFYSLINRHNRKTYLVIANHQVKCFFAHLLRTRLHTLHMLQKFYDSFHLKGPIMRCTLWSTLSKTIGNCANTWIQRSLNWFSPRDNRFYTVKPMPAGNIHFIHQLKVIYWKLPNNLLFSVSKFISLHFFINLAKPSNRPLFAVLNLLIKDTINSLNL